MTTVEDGFTYVMAAAVAIKIMALESAVSTKTILADQIDLLFEVQDLGGNPLNSFNIRVANNMFVPFLSPR